MSGRPALNLYGYLISSARTLSVQALFGEHCCWFADSFGEWCSGPKRKHSRRCLLLMKISLHACVHSQSKPSAACAFTQSFSERCPTTLHLWARRLFNCFVRKKCLEVQMKAANLTAAHGEFLLMEAGISAELRDTVRRVTHFTTQEVTQLLTEMMSSQFLSATRNNLQTAFNAKHVSTCSPTGKMMLGFQYLFLCVSTHLYGSVQLLFVFCKPRNSFSSSSHRLN